MQGTEAAVGQLAKARRLPHLTPQRAGPPGLEGNLGQCGERVGRQVKEEEPEALPEGRGPGEGAGQEGAGGQRGVVPG